MKIDSPSFYQLAGLIGAKGVHAWMSTLEYKVAFFDPKTDPVHPEYQGQKIYVFWHEYILFPLYLRGHCNFAMLLGRHRDAEMLSYMAYHLGFECVRGSTNRGAAAAIRELAAKGQNMNLTITPDGPRGPRRQLAQGPVYLASKLGLPIVAMGFGYDRPRRAKSWDRFALPRLGSRARAVVSPEMHIPADLDRDRIEQYRLRVEGVLNRLTSEAETWAADGTRKTCEVPVWKQTAPLSERVLGHTLPMVDSQPAISLSSTPPQQREAA